MPWRETKDPYAIWLSEIMLQQTTVVTVIPYYHRFLKKFPTLKDLANAPLEELLKEWAGLGYYNRIRNFQAAAKQIVSDFKGVIPKDYQTLLSLKGFGPYTAASVSSIAFNEPNACVDGNVIRVIARLFCYDQEIKSPGAKKYFQQKADELLHPKQAGDFNQAMMEFGATLCTPHNPQCPICPVKIHCLAHQKGCVEKLPAKTKQVYVKKYWDCFLITSKNKCILLRQRKNESVLKDMWEIPYVETKKNSEPNPIPTNPQKKIKSFSHSIMNQRIQIQLWQIENPNDAFEFSNTKWIPFSQIKNYPLTTVAKKALNISSKLI
ncbi:MAG: hypothetical protein ACD_73C00106G0001 [uncultured bacterium]|nr:MAG: hypothetical protein ACD_73C00106G0001 [uncultured bacterium]